MLSQYVITSCEMPCPRMLSFPINWDTLTDDMLQFQEHYFTDKLHVVNVPTCHNSL